MQQPRSWGLTVQSRAMLDLSPRAICKACVSRHCRKGTWDALRAPRATITLSSRESCRATADRGEQAEARSTRYSLDRQNLPAVTSFLVTSIVVIWWEQGDRFSWTIFTSRWTSSFESSKTVDWLRTNSVTFTSWKGCNKSTRLSCVVTYIRVHSLAQTVLE